SRDDRHGSNGCCPRFRDGVDPAGHARSACLRAAHLSVGHFLSHRRAASLAAGGGTGLPVLLGRPRRTLRDAPAGHGGCGARSVVAHRRDVRRAGRVGGRRLLARTDPPSPHGAAPVGFHACGNAGTVHVEGLLTVAESSDVVHNRVAMLRVERRISRRELADALGVHYQTIGYLERGEYSPSLHLALRIAAYFEVTVEVVFSLKPFKRLGSSSE